MDIEKLTKEQRELIDLIRRWDAAVPASDDATDLLLILQHFARRIDSLEREVALLSAGVSR